LPIGYARDLLLENSATCKRLGSPEVFTNLYPNTEGCVMEVLFCRKRVKGDVPVAIVLSKLQTPVKLIVNSILEQSLKKQGYAI
jgi:hypothetical protein